MPVSIYLFEKKAGSEIPQDRQIVGVGRLEDECRFMQKYKLRPL
jgi:hypothetical protein